MHSHKNAQTHTDMLVYFSTSIFLDTHTSPQLSFLRAQPTSHLSTHTFKQEHVIIGKSTSCEIGRCQRTMSIWTHRAHGLAQRVQLSPSLPWHINTQLCKTELCDILAEFPLLRATDCLEISLTHTELLFMDHPNNEQYQLHLLICLWGFIYYAYRQSHMHLLCIYTIHNVLCTF